MGIIATTWYVAQCNECQCHPDLDGEEYKPTQEAAKDAAVYSCDWVETADGRLLCDECGAAAKAE